MKGWNIKSIDWHGNYQQFLFHPVLPVLGFQSHRAVMMF